MQLMFLVFLAMLLCLQVKGKQTVKLGVIFDSGTDELQSALVSALQKQRQDPEAKFSLEPAVSVISTVNIFKISRLICDKVFSLGVHLLLGYVNPDAFDTLHSYANTFQMPFVAPWFPQKVRQVASSVDFALSMRPDYHRAVLDVIQHYRWSDVIYIYDSEDGLHRLQQIMQSLTPDSATVHIQHAHRVFDADSALLFLRSLEAQDRWSRKRVVLDCTSALSQEIIISHVRDVHLGRRNYHYLLSSLAMDSVWDATVQEYGAINITGFRLVDPEAPLVRQTLSQWNSPTDSTFLSARTALMYDSVLVISEALRLLWHELVNSPAAAAASGSSRQLNSTGGHQLVPAHGSGQQQLLQAPVFNCSQGFPDVTGYSNGGKIMKQLRKVKTVGLTGNISFSENGKRYGYKLDVMEMSATSETVKIGEWTDSRGFAPLPRKANKKIKPYLKKKGTLVITTIEEEPFIRVLSGREGRNMTGNDLIVGYCKDLAELLSRQVGFKYEMRLVRDRKYGAINTSVEGNWDGIIGELVRQEADIAVAPLTISLNRERVVAFTKPYMSLGISIMIKKPIKKNPGVFSFLNPLSREIWMCIVFAYLGVSIVLFLVSRFSPYEWRLHETLLGTAVNNDFTIYNSMWFVLGALMQQGSDLSPRSVSGRIVGACWWFFCLILISSYTANLAAFLTVERLVTPINSVHDLATQGEVEYGTLSAGSTAEFFQNSKIGVYQRMSDYMASNKDVVVRTYEEGIRRVRTSRGKYALLIESTKNDYVNERQPCDTMKVGRNLDAKGYGVATALDSPWRDALNLAVLQLKENGELAKLENKWWFTNSECNESEESKASELLLNNVAGIFYILIGGLLLAMMAALVEFCYKSRTEAKRAKTSHMDAMRTRAKLTISGATETEGSRYYTPTKQMNHNLTNHHHHQHTNLHHQMPEPMPHL